LISRQLLIQWFLLCCAFALARAETRETAGVRTISAVQAGKAPEIDGLLDDACWKAAEWQGDFIQLEPSMGRPARAATRVAVSFDQQHVYVAFRCLNPTGSSANSRIVRRDGDMDMDNAVTVYFDTFHSRRDCYYFSTNSLGTQVDGRIGEDGRSNDKSWDCTWSAASREDSSGWTAEIAVPVGEIRFPEESEEPWGINFRRNYPELFETSFWSERDQAWRVSQSGDLVGLAEFSKRFSASLYPYMVTLDANKPMDTGRRTIYSSGGTEIISGADLRFNIGAAANGNLTYNPDFATVEADQEVINLTRYETFFPEKRLYFLEGAELFKNRINVFHSRRIGDIDYGLKSNGRVGKYNFSVLTARERAVRGNPSSHTSVFRLQRDVFGSSNIGLLAVDRSFSSGFNRALSTDATIYLPSHVKLTSQFIGSFPSGDGKFTKAYFLRCARETEIYHYHLRFTNIDPGFRENVNAVGFIPDDDRRELDSDVTYDWWIKDRSPVEKIEFDSRNNVFWSHSGALRSVKLRHSVEVLFRNKVSLAFNNNYQTELYERRFHNHSIQPEIGYNLEQWNSYSLSYRRGRNFGSDFELWTLETRFKPTGKLALQYRLRYLNLSPDPEERSTTQHVMTGDYNFTPDLYIRLFTQFNSRNDRFYLYGLFGWRFSPPFGALYLAYTADRFDLFDDLLEPVSREDQRAFFVKLTVPLSL